MYFVSVPCEESIQSELRIGSFSRTVTKLYSFSIGYLGKTDTDFHFELVTVYIFISLKQQRPKTTRPKNLYSISNGY